MELCVHDVTKNKIPIVPCVVNYSVDEMRHASMSAGSHVAKPELSAARGH